MIIAVDQASPWLIPSNAFAATIQPQDGARIIMSGTGSAASHPTSSTDLRPKRSERRPAK
jgi:hypothetical protein